MGRRRTLGDLYAISWRQGVYLGVFFPVRCLEQVPTSACASLLWDCLCLLHVKNSALGCAMCVLACRFGEEGAWGSKVFQVKDDAWGPL